MQSRFLPLGRYAAQPIAFESPVSCAFEKEATTSVPENIRTKPLEGLASGMVWPVV